LSKTRSASRCCVTDHNKEDVFIGTSKSTLNGHPFWIDDR